MSTPHAPTLAAGAAPCDAVACLPTPAAETAPAGPLAASAAGGGGGQIAAFVVLSVLLAALVVIIIVGLAQRRRGCRLLRPSTWRRGAGGQPSGQLLLPLPPLAPEASAAASAAAAAPAAAAAGCCCGTPASLLGQKHPLNELVGCVLPQAGGVRAAGLPPLLSPTASSVTPSPALPPADEDPPVKPPAGPPPDIRIVPLVVVMPDQQASFLFFAQRANRARVCRLAAPACLHARLRVPPRPSDSRPRRARMLRRPPPPTAAAAWLVRACRRSSVRWRQARRRGRRRTAAAPAAASMPGTVACRQQPGVRTRMPRRQSWWSDLQLSTRQMASSQSNSSPAQRCCRVPAVTAAPIKRASGCPTALLRRAAG